MSSLFDATLAIVTNMFPDSIMAHSPIQPFFYSSRFFYAQTSLQRSAYFFFISRYSPKSLYTDQKTISSYIVVLHYPNWSVLKEDSGVNKCGIK